MEIVESPPPTGKRAMVGDNETVTDADVLLVGARNVEQGVEPRSVNTAS